jgi:hypothetical protein
VGCWCHQMGVRLRTDVGWSRRVGKNILFVTNNASKSRAMYKSTFDSFGIQASVVSSLR